MVDHIKNCIDLITKEIEDQRNEQVYGGGAGLIKNGTMHGLNLSRDILTKYWEDNN